MMKKTVNIRITFPGLFWVLLLTCCTFYGFAEPKTGPISWSIYTTANNPNLVGMNNIFMTSPGKGWIGIYSHGNKIDLPLYRLQNDRIVPDETFSFPAHRTFVMDGLSEDHFWVFAYSPRTDSQDERAAVLTFYNGKSWQSFDCDWVFAKCMDVAAENNVWIGFNGGGILNFKKEGESWKTEKYILEFTPEKRGVPHVYGIKMVSPEEGWACGSDGLAARYFEGTWEIIPVPPALERTFFRAVDISADGSVWFAAEKGKIARYHQGKWTLFETGVFINLYAIQMVTPHEGWAAGEKGVILYYQKGLWKSQPSPVIDTFFDIQMTSARSGWIMGGRTVLKADEENLSIFNDVSEYRNDGINLIRPYRVRAIDINGDRNIDLFFSTGRLFKNDGSGTFSDISLQSGLPVDEEKGHYFYYTWGDYDRDRNPDLFTIGDFDFKPNRLFLNRGAGKFKDVPPGDTAADGGMEHSAVSIDYDNDGDIDIFVNRIFEESRVPADNYLYENRGYGDFEKRLLSTEKILSYSGLWGDLDGDRYLDLILSGEFTVFLNDREGNLVKYPESLKDFNPRIYSFQNLLFDEDLDGDLDLFTITDYPLLLRNNGKGYFDPAAAQVLYDVRKTTNNQETISKAADIDNDGYPELFFNYEIDQIRQMVVLKRQPGGTYENISGRLGLSNINIDSLELFDLDNDGDLDLYASIVGTKSIIRENTINSQLKGNHFFMINVHGVKSNTQGTGAKIMIYTAGGLGKPDQLKGHKQVGVGESSIGSNYSGVQHFGLPGEGYYDIEVTFPSGRQVQRLKVRSGAFLNIYEYSLPLRLVYGAAGSVKRMIYFINPLVEIVKLLLVIALLLVTRYYLYPASGGLIFMGRWVSLGTIAVLYGITMIYAAGYSFFVSHVVPVLEVIILIAAGLTADRLLSAVKNAYFLGPYRLRDKIGEGGMGVVYRAKNIITGQTVALKVLGQNITASEESRLRFTREGKLMEQLCHPNIVKVFETGNIGGKAYISMEYLRGKSLGEIIKELGEIDLFWVVRILLPLCDALEYIHERGIIHRDIKSDNIFLAGITTKTAGGKTTLARMGNSSKDSFLPFPVKLMDFGLAKNASMLTRTGHEGLMGTLIYMSPEQAQGKQIDRASDIFSLGVVMYEALTGNLPFTGDHEVAVIQQIINKEPRSVSAINPAVPEKAAALVSAMLAKSKQERPSSAGEVKMLLKTLLDDSLENMSYSPGSREKPVKKSAAPKPLSKIEKSFGRKSSYFLDDYKSRNNFRVSKITSLTERWLSDYRLSRELMSQGKVDRLYKIMPGVIDIIHEVMFYLNDDEKMAYLEKHEINKVLEFWERLKD